MINRIKRPRIPRTVKTKERLPQKPVLVASSNPRKVSQLKNKQYEVNY